MKSLSVVPPNVLRFVLPVVNSVVVLSLIQPLGKSNYMIIWLLRVTSATFFTLQSEVNCVCVCMCVCCVSVTMTMVREEGYRPGSTDIVQ